jgi:hypothetical protein
MPTRFPRPRRRGVQSIVAALTALVLVAGASAGCERQKDDGTLANGLLILSGEIGGMKLRVLEEGDPGGRAIALPDSTTTWVAAGRTNVLVAVLVDGRTFVSGPLGDEDPDWRLVEAVTTADVPPEPPL